MKLLIDGNFFVHNTFNALPGTVKTDAEVVAEILEKQLTDKISKYKSFLTGVYFCVDRKSWRKNFYDAVDYKIKRKIAQKNSSARKKAETALMFNAFDLLQQRISDKIPILSVQGAEADDIIAYFSHRFNQKGQNVIVLSGDSDLYQLITTQINDKQGWTIVESNGFVNAFVISPELFNWLNSETGESDIFQQNATDWVLQEFKRVLNLKYKIIHPVFELWVKILSGDTSDDIPSISYKKTKSGYRAFGERSAEKAVIEYQKQFPVLTFSDIITAEHQIGITKTVYAVGKTGKAKTELLENIKRNITLIHLHQAHLPSGIAQSLGERWEKYHDFKFNVNSFKTKTTRARVSQKKVKENIDKFTL